MYHFVTGAQDPEMDRIHELLDSYEHSYTSLDVNPAAAYTIDLNELDYDRSRQLVLIECGQGLPHWPEGDEWIIDHHHVSHPTANWPKQMAFQASSLGQLHRLLRREPEEHDLIVGICDHDVFTGYGWLFDQLGIDLEQVKNYRLSCIAKDAPKDQAVKLIDEWAARIHDSPTITIGTERVVDLRAVDLEPGYSLEYLTLMEASLVTNCPVLVKTQDEQDVRTKYMLKHAQAGTIEQFLATWQEEHHLTDLFGVPSRGYAGGYVPN